MTFKESMAQDLNVFLDLDEFGEIIEIDEVKLPAIIIKHTGDQKLADIAHKHEGYYIHPDLHGTVLIGNFITVYFKTLDYVKERGRIPKHTEFTRINGTRYKVNESSEEFGMTKLICSTDSMNTPKYSAPRLPGLYE